MLGDYDFGGQRQKAAVPTGAHAFGGAIYPTAIMTCTVGLGLLQL